MRFTETKGDSGRYSAIFKPFHLIGLELNISILSAALRQQPTGAPTGFNADVAAVAKRDLNEGEALDGEGGYTVWGKLMPAAASVSSKALPIGLASNVTLSAAVKQGQIITMQDINAETTAQAWQLRDKTLAQFAPGGRS